MSGRTQSFLLLLFGAALIRLAAGDALLRYVRPVARPWVLIAGIGVVGLALWSLVAGWRHGDDASATEGTDPPTPTDAHGHSAVSRAAWLVLAPVVAILVVSPPALGAFSAARQPATVAKPNDIAFPPLPAGDPVPDKLIDFAARSLWDSGRTLTGRTISLTGFVLGPASGGFTIARLVITCCAADARPIDIGIDWARASPPKDQWVTITGRYAGVSPTDATLPMLRATAVQAIAAPANPYDD
jgi:uncharacterized repeat protein (TIGR03943 family)